VLQKINTQGSILTSFIETNDYNQIVFDRTAQKKHTAVKEKTKKNEIVKEK
jgi:hypothetical protein